MHLLLERNELILLGTDAVATSNEVIIHLNLCKTGPTEVMSKEYVRYLQHVLLGF